jgi:predicted house-cleaning noncanonical NTP pyrophosphatase (MazG superfamily)
MAEKLVRDNVVFFSLEKKDGRKFRIAKPEELPSLLALKLEEECKELIHELKSGFGSDSTSFDKVLEEMADVVDVIELIMDHTGVSDEILNKRRDQKEALKGRFKKLLVMETE